MHQGAIQVFAKAAIAVLELTHALLRSHLEALTHRLLWNIVPNLHFIQAVEYLQAEAAGGGAPAIGSHAVLRARKRIPNDWVKGPCQSA